MYAGMYQKKKIFNLEDLQTSISEGTKELSVCLDFESFEHDVEEALALLKDNNYSLMEVNFDELGNYVFKFVRFLKANNVRQENQNQDERINILKEIIKKQNIVIKRQKLIIRKQQALLEELSDSMKQQFSLLESVELKDELKKI